MTAILAAQAVTVRAGAATLVDAVSLALTAGETVALVGPNGAGKSTLLRALSGDQALGAGHILLRGRDLSSYAPRALAEHRAVLSQSVTVAFPFTVAEIVAMGAGDRRGAKVDTLVEEALATVDLASFRDRVITTLSGGEQQRAHFARVLVQLHYGEAAHGPGVLLLDEPTASLDLRHQLDIARCARGCAARGVAVLAILHDLNLATLFADRVIVMHRGGVAAEGAPREVVTDAVLTRVFGVSSAVGIVPPGGAPFVLPHAAQAAAR